MQLAPISHQFRLRTMMPGGGEAGRATDTRCVGQW